MQQKFLFFLLLASTCVFADPQKVETAKPSGSSNEVLSKDFFDPKPAAKPGAGDSRYSAGEPDYNTEQREQWLKACEKYKNKELESYRKCFQDEKAKSKEELRKKIEEVEFRQSLPMRNVNPLLDEQERKMNNQDDE